MDLLTATSKIKEALSQKDYIAALSHYHLKGGRAYASNGALHASAPINEPLEHVVPADELEKAFSILGKDAAFEWSAESVVIKKQRKKMTIRLLPPETVDLIEPTPRKTELPLGFLKSIKMIRPFISEDASRPWALTAWLHRNLDGQYVWTATNNVVVIQVAAEDTPGQLKGSLDSQIPNFALDFLTKREEAPTSMGEDSNRVSFFYRDGSVLTSQLFAAKMPQQVPDILTEKFNENQEGPFFVLTDEWKEAYKSLVQLSAEEVVLGAKHMSAGKRQATMEIEVDSPIPRDVTKKSSHWNPKFLTPIVDIATHIDFAAYPKPARFYGPGVKGLIVGKIV